MQGVDTAGKDSSAPQSIQRAGSASRDSAPYVLTAVWVLGLAVIATVWAAIALPHEATRVAAVLVTGTVAAALVTAQRTLAQLAAERSAAAAASRSAIAAAQAKSRFLSLVSRELRAPLDAILAEGERLAATSEPERGAAIASQARRLLGSVDALLDFAALGRGPVKLEEEAFRFGPLLDEAIAEVEATIAPTRRGMRVDPGLRELVLHADRRALRQVVLQLVGNAARFSRHDDWIELRLERDRDALGLVIEDEGVGIPASDQARVVEAFERANGTTAGRGGSGLGLGLAITRALVEAHGGRLDLHSVEGVGTRVTVKLPAAREAALPEALRETRQDPMPATAAGFAAAG